MYYPNNIEEICYDENHIRQVLTEIKMSFYNYYDKFIETEAGIKITEGTFRDLLNEFSNSNIRITNNKDNKRNLKSIIKESISKFEKDRQIYLDILDEECLEEHQDDPSNFKNTVLKNECPIIRLTLQNKKAKELDNYRKDFKYSNPNELLDVVTNLISFANDYIDSLYEEEEYENFNNLDQLKLSPLNDEDYIVYGVIGGGIKSHFLYKYNPAVFPNRSREALWAFWYLTNKKAFDCKEDSEFLNINKEKSTTQQNFFYPYDLFAFYAYNIYLLLKKEAEKCGLYINKEYRYVLVDAFLSFVAQENNDEINLLRSQLKEDSYHGYH